MNQTPHAKIRKQAFDHKVEDCIRRLAWAADPTVCSIYWVNDTAQEASLLLSELVGWDQTYRIEREKLMVSLRSLTARNQALERQNRELRQHAGLKVNPR